MSFKFIALLALLSACTHQLDQVTGFVVRPVAPTPYKERSDHGPAHGNLVAINSQQHHHHHHKEGALGAQGLTGGIGQPLVLTTVSNDNATPATSPALGASGNGNQHHHRHHHNKTHNQTSTPSQRAHHNVTHPFGGIPNFASNNAQGQHHQWPLHPRSSSSNQTHHHRGKTPSNKTEHHQHHHKNSTVSPVIATTMTAVPTTVPPTAGN